MTDLEFAPIIAYLEAALNKKVPQAQAQVYFSLLADLPAEAVRLAAVRALADMTIPNLPSAGLLRQHALSAQRPAPLDYDEAWGLVLKAIKRYGFCEVEYRVVKGEMLPAGQPGLESLPVAVRQAAERLGWEMLCSSGTDKMPTLHAQFRDVYRQGESREKRDNLLPNKKSIAGLLEGIGKE